MVNCACNITNQLAIEYTGIVSASMSGTTEMVHLLSTCADPNAEKTLKGPSTGTINITAYPFEMDADKFLGVVCESNAQVNIPYITKYDCMANITRYILQKGGQASREGDVIAGITIVEDNVCSYRALNADASGGPVTPYIDKTKTDGYGMVSTLRPLPFDTTIQQTYRILGIDAHLQSFSVNVSFSRGAIAQYGFIYSIPGCDTWIA